MVLQFVKLYVKTGKNDEMPILQIYTQQ